MTPVTVQYEPNTVTLLRDTAAVNNSRRKAATVGRGRRIRYVVKVSTPACTLRSGSLLRNGGCTPVASDEKAGDLLRRRPHHEYHHAARSG